MNSLPVSAQDVRYSIDEIVSQVLEQSSELLDGSTQENMKKTRRLGTSKAIERQVKRELSPLLSKLSSNQTLGSKSILPSVAGENFAERIVADVVAEISAYADRETLIENSEGQRQLLNSLERTVSKLMVETRRPQMADMDWVDVQAFGQSEQETSESEAVKDSVSPWFTRTEDKTEDKTDKQSSGSLKPMQQAAARVLKMVSENPTRPEIIARQTGLKVQEVQQIVSSIQGFEQPTSQAVSQVLKLVSENATRPEIIARQTGLKVQEVQEIVGRFSTQDVSSQGVNNRTHSILAGENSSSNSKRMIGDKTVAEHPLETLWERATSPIELPGWTGMGTASFKPTIGESARGWRLSPKRQPVHPYAVDVDSTVLQPSMFTSEENTSDSIESESKPSPWLSRKDREDSLTGFGFVPQSISGDAKLSSNEIAMFGGQSKAVELSVGEVRKQQARWLEPNRTVVLDNGTVIHAKVAKRLGLSIQTASKQNLPLSWTLEGLQLKSDHRSLPTWAKRASGKPQVNASPEFLVALAKASSAEDVAEVILQNSGRSQDGILPKTAMTAIDQIRREAHRSLQDMESAQQEMLEQSTVRSGRDRSRRRVSRTARAVADGLTGLKPISMTAPTASGEAAGTDKVSKLAKQLESLVSLAESNRRDEAREGVRMAEESHDAIAEGQALSKGEERDNAVDIEALRQEVMRAFEQEMSIRSLRSFENSNNTDPWW